MECVLNLLKIKIFIIHIKVICWSIFSSIRNSYLKIYLECVSS